MIKGLTLDRTTRISRKMDFPFLKLKKLSVSPVGEKAPWLCLTGKTEWGKKASTFALCNKLQQVKLTLDLFQWSYKGDLANNPHITHGHTKI